LTKPLIILGSGGHASVLVDMLKQQGRVILGFVSPGVRPEAQVFSDIPHYSEDGDVFGFDKSKVKLVNGIGSIPRNNLRTLIYNDFSSHGYEFETVISSDSLVSSYAKLHDGVQVMAGAIIQTGAVIGANSIINTGAIVDHDCNLGINNHVAPGATISGQVHSEENVHFGTGASVIQGVKIGKNVVIGAGAAITRNVQENTVCFPSRITKKVNK
jgi:sugar O-acyltransferase (sialic acid O-acetyltransferase NeuD family)